MCKSDDKYEYVQKSKAVAALADKIVNQILLCGWVKGADLHDIYKAVHDKLKEQLT